MAHLPANAKPGWAVAEALRRKLQELCPELQFAVYGEYDDQSREETYHVIAKHPKTNEVRFRRAVPLQEFMTDEGQNLLLAQLWLVTPTKR